MIIAFPTTMDTVYRLPQQSFFQMAQSLMERMLRTPFQVLLMPLAQKILATLLALYLLRRINRILSWYSQNNWIRETPWNPEMELVLLTGGCSGIGAQIMRDLADLNIKVVILDINEPDFKLPPGIFFYQVDVTSTNNLKSVADKIRKTHGDPTILINNAGVGYGNTIIDEPEQAIRRTFEVNILSHFWTVKEFLPSMIKNNHGHVITVASLASFVSLGETVDYACSKAGALAFHEGLTQEIRHWYGAQKIRTSIIHPLWVQTPMIDQLVRAGSHFRQQILTPKDISTAVVKQIISQSSGQIIVPASHTHVGMIRGLPNWLQEFARNRASLDLWKLRMLEKQGVLH